MKQLARSYCWWPGIEQEIESRVNRCEQCQNHRPNPPRADVLSWPEPTGPWERIHIDYAPKFKNRALLIIVDAFSRWVEVGVTAPDSTSSSKTIEILSGIFSRYGFPRTVVSDNGPQFSSKKFQTFMKAIGTTHK